MGIGTRRRWALGAGLAIAALAVAAGVAYGVAVSALRGRLEAALGPRSEMAAIAVGWSGVVVHDLRVPAPKGWPAKETFRAERVEIAPTLLSFFSSRHRIRSVTVTKPYISVVRSRARKLAALPGLFPSGTRPGEAEVAVPDLTIRTIALEDGVLEIFDESVGPPPVKLRLEQFEATLHDVDIPALQGRSEFTFDAVVKGKARDGRAHIAGWVELETNDYSIKTELRSVDLVPLEPYLVRDGARAIRAGSLDLDLQSDVRGGQLMAPGKLALVGLELEPDEGVLGTFMGLSRKAMLASLRDKGDRIEVDFVLEGDVTKPEFSLGETLSTKIEFSLAKALGISIEGLAEGVGTIGLKSGEAAGEAVEGIGGAIEDLIEGRPKE